MGREKLCSLVRLALLLVGLAQTRNLNPYLIAGTKIQDALEISEFEKRTARLI